jgi:hypothetical protein
MQGVACYSTAILLDVNLPFGKALKVIQGARKNTDVARRALGPQAKTEDVRDFANYFSRIVHGHVPNVYGGISEWSGLRGSNPCPRLGNVTRLAVTVCVGNYILDSRA